GALQPGHDPGLRLVRGGFDVAAAEARHERVVARPDAQLVVAAAGHLLRAVVPQARQPGKRPEQEDRDDPGHQGPGTCARPLAAFARTRLHSLVTSRATP